MTDKEFIEYTMETWDISPETSFKDHPAPFPLEIPKRCIKLYTYPGAVVLDPFLGSGTTLRACRENDRLGLGFELNKDYEEYIKKRSLQEIKPIEQYSKITEYSSNK